MGVCLSSGYGDQSASALFRAQANQLNIEGIGTTVFTAPDKSTIITQGPLVVSLYTKTLKGDAPVSEMRTEHRAMLDDGSRFAVVPSAFPGGLMVLSPFQVNSFGGDLPGGEGEWHWSETHPNRLEFTATSPIGILVGHIQSIDGVFEERGTIYALDGVTVLAYFDCEAVQATLPEIRNALEAMNWVE